MVPRAPATRHLAICPVRARGPAAAGKGVLVLYNTSAVRTSGRWESKRSPSAREGLLPGRATLAWASAPVAPRMQAASCPVAPARFSHVCLCNAKGPVPVVPGQLDVIGEANLILCAV
ncbi:hypothetical protein BRADI_3g08865v3 [Brachypodium distachyon]|uniref:Uncharacterized protein n=1 Tax=Brachypodium distachyon TaxID=15368 RepID=A0A2K2CW16_BRADI|nr:hypothetical protein BRADI_3g08865v3 [Brachypodium distachyon]